MALGQLTVFEYGVDVYYLQGAVSQGLLNLTPAQQQAGMLNPQQNININISYNLNHKPVPTRPKKANKARPIANCDIEIKLKSKHHPEEQKRTANNEKKPHKKKPSNFVRNTFTPDLFNDRRFKTEGPSADLEAAKKEPKTKTHSKSTQPGAKAIAAAISSKKSGSTKAVRSGRQGHVNSFLLINPKKPEGRQKSEPSFSRNDRVVSKLLNMSMLASELGGSRPITSERQSAQCPSRSFKEYLSSMDMRLLRTLQDDVPVFIHPTHAQDTVKSLMAIKGLSLQQLTSKVVLIQRAWRKALSKMVVHKYKQLFRQATDKLINDNREKSHQISAYAAESIGSETFNLDHLPPIGSAFPFHFTQKNKLSHDNSFEDLPVKWAEEGRPHLDLARYQQLVVEGERGAACERRHFDPATLLDAFMEQSQFNKQWMEQEFQPSKPSSPQRLPSGQDSLDESQDYNRIKYASPEEEHQMLERRMQQLESNKRRGGRGDKEDSQEAVIRGYLECGLGSFGLRVDEKILQLEEREERSDQQMDSFSDQAIGVRFQQANRSRIRPHQAMQVQPSILAPGLEEKVGQIRDAVVSSLINEFAMDISCILRKTSPPAPPSRPPPRSSGIPTGFAAVRGYLTQLLAFLKRTPSPHAEHEEYLQRIISNINKDIGPSSLEILSYLRPQAQPTLSDEFDEDGLFVVPAELFDTLEVQLQQKNGQMGLRTRAYTNFWHRCIFESFNECLDYQRPFGVDGRPYDWIIPRPPFRPVTRNTLEARLLSGQERLLDLTLMVGGIIFDKVDGPFAQADFSEEQRLRINEERLSRILATQLLESEHSWINYADEQAQLLVQLARMLENSILDEAAVELQRTRRRRKLLPDQ